MRFFTLIASWWSGLRERAAEHHSRATIVAVCDYFSPVLDEQVGERVACWRQRGEPDDAYALRLGAHITEKLNELEALLQRVLDHRR